MPLRRPLLAVLLCVSATWAAWAADVNTLKQGLISGVEVTSISDKEIVFTKDGKETKLPLDEVLQIDYGTAGKPKSDDKFSDVELTDGTILHCSSFLVKKDKAYLTLLTTGQEVIAPLTSISNVLVEAHVSKNRKDWDERIGKKARTFDVQWRLTKDGKYGSREGTFTGGDETGQVLKFKVKDAGDVDVKITDTYGLIFARGVDANAKPIIGKMTDMQGNLIYVSAAKATPAAVTVTTPCGVELAYTPKTVARLDYTSDKIAYLNEMKPTNVVELSPFDTVEHYQINRNLDGGPLKLEGKIYTNGLAIHAYTELEFNLKGEYREFRAYLGVDDAVGGHDGPTPVRIVAIDRADKETELAKLIVERKDRGKAPKPLAINIKDVQKLKIIVGSGDLQDIGKHVDLADAKVTK
jgi:hypothetical protein